MITETVADTLSIELNRLRETVEYQKLFGVSYFKLSAPPTMEIVNDSIRECKLCSRVSESRKETLGSGNMNADLMFIGYLSGGVKVDADTPETLLVKIINAMELKTEDVYTTNCIKCFSVLSEEDSLKEVMNCFNYVIKEIAIVKPKVICTMGTLATQSLLNTVKPLSELRGRFYEYKKIKVIPTYHPELLLREPEKKRAVWEDMKKILSALKKG